MTNVPAGYSEFDEILFIGHVVLSNEGQRFVIAEQEDTDPDHSEEGDGRTESDLGWWYTQVSLAMDKAWIRMSNAERAPSRPFGRWEVESIVESCGESQETVVRQL